MLHLFLALLSSLQSFLTMTFPATFLIMTCQLHRKESYLATTGKQSLDLLVVSAGDAAGVCLVRKATAGESGATRKAIDGFGGRRHAHATLLLPDSNQELLLCCPHL